MEALIISTHEMKIECLVSKSLFLWIFFWVSDSYHIELKYKRSIEIFKKDANGTQCSQAVTHPSTNRAQHYLTSVIGRELVCSMWCGRWREYRINSNIHESLLDNKYFCLLDGGTDIFQSFHKIACLVPKIKLLWILFWKIIPII